MGSETTLLKYKEELHLLRNKVKEQQDNIFNYLGHLEHELTFDDCLVIRYKELFEKELKVEGK